MPSLGERMLPELILVEPGAERQCMVRHAVNGQRTRVAVFLAVVGSTGVFVLWDKLVASVPSRWSVYLLFMLCLVGFGIAVWLTRRDIRRRLRAQLAKKGIPICIPCGYDLTGNVSGTCPECGTGFEEPMPDQSRL